MYVNLNLFASQVISQVNYILQIIMNTTQKEEQTPLSNPSKPKILIVLFILICIQLILAIALIVVLAVLGYIGFEYTLSNLPITLSDSCSDSYSLLRYISATPYIISISFVFSVVETVSTLAMLIICLKSLLSDHSMENTPLTVKIMPISAFIGNKSMRTVYVLQSITILTIVGVFGYYLSYLINLTKNCNYSYNNTQILVITIISGVLLLFALIIWIIIVHIIISINKQRQLFNGQKDPAGRKYEDKSREDSKQYQDRRRQYEERKRQKSQRAQWQERKRKQEQSKRAHNYQDQSKQYNHKRNEPRKPQKYHAFQYPQRNDTVENLMYTNKKTQEDYRHIRDQQQKRQNPLFKSRKQIYESPYSRVHRKQIYEEDHIKDNENARKSKYIFSPSRKKEESPKVSPQRKSRINFDNIPYQKSHEKPYSRQKLYQEDYYNIQDQSASYKRVIPIQGTKQRVRPKLHQSYFRQSARNNNNNSANKQKKKRGILADYIKNKYAY